MKVILLGELRGKGGEGDIVEVAQGYAENFLFPQKIAQPATPGNIKQLEERRHNIAKREAERFADAEATKAALDGKLVVVDAKIGEEGQLFGSITAAQIAEAIKEQLGVEIDRKRIVRSSSIKTAGRHDVMRLQRLPKSQSPMRQKRSPQYRMSNRERLPLRLSQRSSFWRIFRGLEVGDGELFVNWGFLQNYQLSERSNHQIS